MGSEQATTAVTAAEAAQYRRQGYVRIRGVLSEDEIAELRAEFDRLFAEPRLVHRDNLRAQGRTMLDGRYVVDRLDPVRDVSAAAARLVSDPRLVAAASAVLGEEAASFKEKFIAKPPGAQGYDVHHDYAYWRPLNVPHEQMVTALAAVDPVTPPSGPTFFYPGLHDHPRHISGDGLGWLDPASGRLEPGTMEGVEPDLVALDPGDIILFSPAVPHGSGPNRSSASRRTIFISYAATRFGDLHEAYYQHFHALQRADRSAWGQAEWFFQ